MMRNEDFALLSLLGLETQKEEPSVKTFPLAFNQADGPRIWTKVLSDKSLKEVEDKWPAAIQLYLSLCDKAGVFPFSQSTQQGKNDTVVRFLTSARRKLQWYFNETKMFSKISPLFLQRSYTFTPNDLLIVSHSQLNPINDPSILDWLKQTPFPGFRHTTRSNLLTRVVQNTIESEIRLDINLQRKLAPFFTISIRCNTPLAYPTSGPPPTRDEMANFVESTIWKPLVRSHRYPGNTSGWRLL